MRLLPSNVDSSQHDVEDTEYDSIAEEDENASDDIVPHAARNGRDRPDEIGMPKGYDNQLFLKKNELYDSMANKNLHPDETALMIKEFEQQGDHPIRRSYRASVVSRHNIPRAPIPEVGLVFLPGADLPQVNRLEQTNMVDSQPDQRTSYWRVNTAASLLSSHLVNGSLSIDSKDLTEVVANHARRRAQSNKGWSHFDREGTRGEPPDAVTIDSDRVKIVHDLDAPGSNWDLCATLIEVDGSSLMDLLHNYRYLIARSGPGANFQQNSLLLERMMEDARRFCMRSPILFRMSTRTRIINSVDIRYGRDSEQSFMTLTTSKGIQEIIHSSASYYNALDPSGSGTGDSTQSFIRPRFLQMLTLLLSLLNDVDLKAMAEFLERTYGISAKRRDLELLFLKVIPLISINPKVFLQSLIPAVEKRTLSDKAVENYEACWDLFVKHLAQDGYLLPASVEELGHAESSWVMKWPEHGGINSSTVFARLQYRNSRLKSFNDVPPARFGFDTGVKQLTVILTNTTTYKIHPQDYEHIATLTPGEYSVEEAGPGGNIYLLRITETVVNDQINEAIKVINKAIQKFHTRPQTKPTRWNGTVSRRLVRNAQPDQDVIFQAVEPAARLTRNEAWIDRCRIALAYKQEGKHVSRWEANHHLTFSSTRVRTKFGRLRERAGKDIGFYKDEIEIVHQFMAADEATRHFEESQPKLSDSPIAHAIHPGDAGGLVPQFWYDYDTNFDNGNLQVRSQRDLVKSINWISTGEQAEITLAKSQSRFFVTPLKPVLETQQDEEVLEGDMALLVGRYIIIAVPEEVDGGKNWQRFVMTNWLEIKLVEEQASNRRGRNARRGLDGQITTFV